jgi:hypothetical protein
MSTNDEDLFPAWWDEGPPDEHDMAEENESLLRRREQFRVAAEYVARAFAALPEVQKVVLFGSVAAPLEKEVPRFRNFRRAGVALYHECKDVDLAVWVNDLDNLKELGRARGQALNRLLAETDIGVAHHQVDVFLMEPGSDRYLGRLCTFGTCPKGKPECLVPGCGRSLFLRQHVDFRLRRDALRPDRVELLFDRARGASATESD